MKHNPPKASTKRKRVSGESLALLGGSVPVLGLAEYSRRSLNKKYPKYTQTGEPRMRNWNILRKAVGEHNAAIREQMLNAASKGGKIPEIIAAQFKIPSIYTSKVSQNMFNQNNKAVNAFATQKKVSKLFGKAAFLPIEEAGPLHLQALREYRRVLYNSKSGIMRNLRNQPKLVKDVAESVTSGKKFNNLLLRNRVGFDMMDDMMELGRLKAKRNIAGLVGAGLLAAGGASLYKDYKNNKRNKQSRGK